MVSCNQSPNCGYADSFAGGVLSRVSSKSLPWGIVCIWVPRCGKILVWQIEMYLYRLDPNLIMKKRHGSSVREYLYILEPCVEQVRIKENLIKSVPRNGGAENHLAPMTDKTFWPNLRMRSRFLIRVCWTRYRAAKRGAGKWNISGLYAKESTFIGSWLRSPLGSDSDKGSSEAALDNSSSKSG